MCLNADFSCCFIITLRTLKCLNILKGHHLSLEIIFQCQYWVIFTLPKMKMHKSTMIMIIITINHTSYQIVEDVIEDRNASAHCQTEDCFLGPQIFSPFI